MCCACCGTTLCALRNLAAPLCCCTCVPAAHISVLGCSAGLRVQPRVQLHSMGSTTFVESSMNPWDVLGLELADCHCLLLLCRDPLVLKVMARWASPKEVIVAGDARTAYYLHLLCALAQRHAVVTMAGEGASLQLALKALWGRGHVACTCSEALRAQGVTLLGNVASPNRCRQRAHSPLGSWLPHPSTCLQTSLPPPCCWARPS